MLWRRQMLERLTSAFVNYELYRSQYKPFQILTNFLLLQMATLTLASFAELYLIATKIDTEHEVFLTYLSGYVFASFNIYLVLGSLSSKLMEDIMRRLVRLLGLLARQPELVVLPSIDIWRRQLLSEQELRLFASTSVFGYAVSYKRIVAFNVQLLAIWLLLWKAIGSFN